MRSCRGFRTPTGRRFQFRIAGAGNRRRKGKNYLRGPGWYRRELDLGKPVDGRRYFLKFDAAGSVADVYLNGSLLGEHRGAFGAFWF